MDKNLRFRQVNKKELFRSRDYLGCESFLKAMHPEEQTKVEIVGYALTNPATPHNILWSVEIRENVFSELLS